MDFISSVFAQWVVFGKENPAIAGAITLGFMGILGWLGNSLPRKIGHFLLSQCTTTLMLDNSGWGESSKSQFGRFMKWYLENGVTALSRRLLLDENGVVGTGDGTHFFFYKGRLFWFSQYRLNSEGVAFEKREILIRGITRSQDLLRDLAKEFEAKIPERSLGMYRWISDTDGWMASSGCWHRTATLGMRELDTIAVDKEKLAEILARIEDFRNSREFYKSRGISYKFFLILHGPAGTGKTSLAKALASLYKRDIYIVNLKEIPGKTLPNAFESIPSGCMALMEDFDAAEATWSRDYLAEVHREWQSGAARSYSTTASGASLDTILNCTDGIVEYDDMIMVGTTNHLDRIDTAFYRPGRGDLVIEIGELAHTDILRYLRTVAGDDYVDKFLHGHHNEELPPITGSSLQTLYNKFRDDPAGLYGELAGPNLVEGVKRLLREVTAS